MQLERIRLKGGLAELNLRGVPYYPDESGAFEVPVEDSRELIRIHGGEVDPGIERLLERVKTVEVELAAAKNYVELKTEELVHVQKVVADYREKSASRKATADIKHTQNNQQHVAQSQNNHQNNNNNNRK